MANLSDAMILYATWAQCFDPDSPPFHRLSSPVQEAWLYTAAMARMLDQTPEPKALVIPGLIHMATWSAHDRWANLRSPGQPQVGFTLTHRPGFFVLETEIDHVPTLTYVPTPPKEIRRVPGLIYAQAPLG